jgi:hypothetical protein
MTDEGLVEEGEALEALKPLPDDAEQLKALTEAGQLGVVEGELEKAAEAPAEEKASEDPPNEPDGPEEEEPAAELVDGVLVPANGEEYEKVFKKWVIAGKPRKFDALQDRWMAIQDGDHVKFVIAGSKSGMAESYGSLSVGGK